MLLLDEIIQVKSIETHLGPIKKMDKNREN
jgi:hypothetical protein